MKSRRSVPTARSGFSLMETVIAIGVLAVLLTAFMAVFGPATTGIRRSISAQEADRLVSATRQEMEILRPNEKNSSGTDYATRFEKAFEWILESHGRTTAMFAYEYRGDLDENGTRSDGTLEPYLGGGGFPGIDYSVQPMIRRAHDPLFLEDLAALEGRVYLVKIRQLVADGGQLVPGQPGEIVGKDGDGNTVPVTNAGDFPEAVLPFVAEFYATPSTDAGYLTGSAFDARFNEMNGDDIRPIFSRNLAVRR